MTKRLHLTYKERQFINFYVSGLNGTQAAMAAYKTNSRNSAAVIASQNLRKLNISKEIDFALDDTIMRNQSIRAISDAMEATIGKSNLPDHRKRLKAVDMALKLLM